MQDQIETLPGPQNAACELHAELPDWSSAYNTMLDDFEALLEAAERITKPSRESTSEPKDLAAVVSSVNSNL